MNGMPSIPRLLFALFLMLYASNEAQAKKPNIILVITDDQGTDRLVVMGIHGFAPPTWTLYTIPVHALRDLWWPDLRTNSCSVDDGSASNEEWSNHTILERERMTTKVTTLPQVLKQAGYQRIFGKWHSAMRAIPAAQARV